MSELLRVENLSVSFDTPRGEIQAVRGVSLALSRGEVLAVVGESGCGKSVLCKAVMKLLPPTARIRAGRIFLNGTDITDYREREMRKLRGRAFSMVFQDPMTALNPTIPVGRQIAEAVRAHNRRLPEAAVRQKVLALMELVGIERGAERYSLCPHSFSGGMRQRAVMAAALAADPLLLFADEPTTALDVTVQAQILDLLREMQDRVGASIIMITHDLGVVAEVSDKVAVMYAGRKVEEGSVEQILFNPQHPYTKALKGCIPHLQRTPTSGRHRLHEIPGMVLGMAELGKDRCSFYERCPCGKPECMEHNPPAKAIDAGHEVACWLYS